MSEWSSVLAVYWVLWAWDSVRILPRRGCNATGGWPRRGARLSFGRLATLGAWPGNWWMSTTDVPLALSPEGLCNRPIGCVGRPAEMPEQVHAWRWAEIRHVGVASSWLFVNGKRFCPDTGHVSGPELLELAGLDAAARATKIDLFLRRWLRPAHLRRRATVLVERTAIPAMLNLFSLGLLAGLSAYVLLDGPAHLAPEVSGAVARQMPLLLGCLLGLHLTAVITAGFARRHLKVRRADRRGSTLLGALLLPPQALRLRTMMGEGFFPPQHPLAMALAFGRKGVRAEWAFQILADLRWPIHGRADPALAREVTAWFGGALEEKLKAMLVDAELSPGILLAAPTPGGSESASYCPRCRDQFVAGRSECPNHVPLRPLGPSTELGSMRSTRDAARLSRLSPRK